MSMDSTINGGSNTAGKANVDAAYNLMVKGPGYDDTGVAVGGGEHNTGGVTIYSGVDDGQYSGVRECLSPETDTDYRMRVGTDTLMDQEEFVDTAQNTGRFLHAFTTLTATMSTAGLLTNSGNIMTTTTGMCFSSNVFVPVGGTQTYVCEISLSFSAQPNANTVIDFGGMLRGAANPFLPLDGVYFRMSSSGLRGIVNKNGVETQTDIFVNLEGGVSPYVTSQNYRFLIQMTNVNTTFWVNNYRYGIIPNPVGGGFPCQTRSLAWGIRHAIVGGAAGAATQALVTGYRVFVRGPAYAERVSASLARAIGTYQGLSGGTMGQLIAGTVTSGTLVKPTAAIPANTSLVANLPNSLGGRIYEQLASGLAANVDGIFASYTVPAAAVGVQARRLVVYGIKLSGMVSTVVVGGPAFTEWYIAFGHTADSLATAEGASFSTATTKAPRRVMLPELTTSMGAAAAAGTLLVQPAYYAKFDAPIIVDPGHRIALVGNKTIPTAITSGVLAYTYQFVYDWI